MYYPLHSLNLYAVDSSSRSVVGCVIYMWFVDVIILIQSLKQIHCDYAIWVIWVYFIVSSWMTLFRLV